MQILEKLMLLVVLTAFTGLSCVSDDVYHAPVPKEIKTTQFKNIDKNIWNYLILANPESTPKVDKLTEKCVDFWKYLADKTKLPAKRAEIILENVSPNLSIGDYIFPEIRNNNLTLLTDFIKFIDGNRIIRTISKDNVCFKAFNLKNFKVLHPELQAECIRQLHVENFINEMMEGAQIIILCEKTAPQENMLILMLKPKILNENTKEVKLISLPESKIYYTILSISSYPYSDIN